MNCLLKHVIEAKREGSLKVKGRRGRRSKKLLDNLKQERGYWKLKGGGGGNKRKLSLWKVLGTCNMTDYRITETN
jgi:hypothetical protein